MASQISVQEAHPDPALRIAGKRAGDRHPQRRECLLDFQVLNPNEGARWPTCFHPDVLLQILGDGHDHSERPAILLRNRKKSLALINRQRVVHSDPQLSCAVLEKRRHLAPLRTLYRDKGRAIRTAHVQTDRGSDPDGAVPRRENRIDGVVAQSFALREAADAKVTEHVEALRGGHPEVTLTIFKKRPHCVTR